MVTVEFEMTRKISNMSETVVMSLNCVIADQEAIYVAVPISSGQRLWKLAFEHNVSDLAEISSRFPREFTQQVLRPNMTEAAKLVGSIRARYPRPVIDPSQLEIPGWSQHDYRRLWERVIEKKVNCLVLASGWVYSVGCVRELLQSLRKGIEIVDCDGNRVSKQSVLLCMEQAIRQSKEMRLKVRYLREALRILSI
jgi:hypothetical protein